MALLEKIRGIFATKEPETTTEPATMPVQDRGPVAMEGTFRTLFTHSYDGEKNLGEIGPMKNYAMNYQALRVRSWQSYVESEITQTVMKRFLLWVMGSGLKLQSEPAKNVLKNQKIGVDQQFNETVESRFGLYAKSKIADYSGMRSLNHISKRGFMNVMLGGDVLVVLRVVKGVVKVQLIDGAHVMAQTYGSEYWPTVLGDGNMIKNGIEMTPEGEHVAYWVQDFNYKYERIPARGPKSGLLMAYMVYGSEYRIDSVRGVPLIATVLETLAKMERYKEAVVGSAEERQKVSFSIEHDIISTGENPFTKQLANAFDVDRSSDQIPVDSYDKALSDTVAATTNKQVVNLPLGAKLKILESKNELYFKEFYSVNIELVCASIGIPPEVALSKYDSNFSASRAALKDWEHTLNVARNNFAEQFLQPIFNLWLDMEILKNTIQAPGYLTARMKGDDMVIEAFRSARWVGAPVPHIDPLKEVMAVRAKLGDTSGSMPLTTLEAATEALNGGEADENIEQYAEELMQVKKLGIVAPIKPVKPIKEKKAASQSD
jgi:capsid protein